MPTLARRRAFFLSTFALTALLLAVPLASASATTSGIDTPAGVVDLPLAVQGMEVMDLTSTGNVGIGVSGPTNRLQVVGNELIYPTTTPTSVATARQFTIGEATDNPNYQLRFGYYNNGTNYAGVIDDISNGAGYSLLLNPSGGNVGIQTANPGEPLDISGIARTNAQFISTAAGAEFRGIAGSYGWMDYSDGTNFYFLLTAANQQYLGYNSLRPYSINLATGAMSIGNSLNVTNGLTADNATISNNETVGGDVTVNGSVLTNSTVNVANALLTPSCGSNEALTETATHTFTCVTIANLAAIGPATVPNCAGMTPTEALSWNGTGFTCVLAGTAVPASLWTSSGGNLYNTSLTGNVGINTATPETLLSIAANSSNVLNIGWVGDCGLMGIAYNSTSTSCGTFDAIAFDTTGDMLVNIPSGASFSFRINNAWNPDALHITATGNVGVNTATPQTTLDVNGPINSGLQTAGASCSSLPLGAMGHDANGNPLNCSNASGSQVWQVNLPQYGQIQGSCIMQTGPAQTGNANDPTVAPYSVSRFGTWSLCNTSPSAPYYAGYYSLSPFLWIPVLPAPIQVVAPAYTYVTGAIPGSPGFCTGPWWDQSCFPPTGGTPATQGCACPAGYLESSYNSYIITTGTVGNAAAASLMNGSDSYTEQSDLSTILANQSTYCTPGQVISVPVTVTTCTKMN